MVERLWNACIKYFIFGVNWISRRIQFSSGNTTWGLKAFMHKILGFAKSYIAFSLSLAAMLLSACSLETAVEDIVPKTALPNLIINDVTVDEDDTASIVVTLSKVWDTDIVIPYSSTGITASQGTDYTAINTNLTIPAGSTVGSISFTPNNDNIYEYNETLSLSFVQPVNAKFSDDNSVLITINNDDAVPIVRFATTSSSTIEDIGITQNIAVSLLTPSEVPLRVNYEITGGTATVTGVGNDINTSITHAPSSGVTYNASNQRGTINFASGVNTINLQLMPASDIADEPNETFDITLQTSVPSMMTPPAYVPAGIDIAQDVYTYTIMNDDTPPTLFFTSATSNVNENIAGGSHTVNLSMTGLSGAPVTVQYRVHTTTPGDATGGGTDYTLVTGTATVAAFSSGTTISIPINNDNIFEGNETFNIELFNVSGAAMGAQDTHLVTILDNEVQPTVYFALTNSDGLESASPSIEVVLSHPSDSPIAVDVNITGGTSTAGDDFLAMPMTVFFSAYDVSENVGVAVTDDTISEANETVLFTLSTPTNVTIAAPLTHTYTILDNDGKPEIKFSNITTSNNEGTATHTINVSLDRASQENVTVGYTITSGTAVGGGVDYTLASTGTITFLGAMGGGSVSQNLSFAVNDDLLSEGAETIVFTLSGNSTNSTLHATDYINTHTILDNEAGPEFEFALLTDSTTEAIGGVNKNIEVVLSPASGAATSVQYRIYTSAPGPGTASASGVDYTLATGTLNFTAGDLSEMISLAVVDDLIREGSEDLYIEIFNPTGGASLGTDKIHHHTINDNEADVIVDFASATSQVLENVAGARSVAVTLSQATSDNVTVQYRVHLTTPGTATGGGQDYTLATGTLTFVGATAGGSTSENISLSVVDDNIFEGNETVIVDLFNATGMATLTGATKIPHTHTIQDDEIAPTVYFAAGTSGALENSTPHTVSVTLSHPSTQNITVDYIIDTPPGTATEGAILPADYTLAAGSLTFTGSATGGSTSQNISITILDDAVTEGSETINLEIQNPTNASLGAQVTHVHTIQDNEGPPTVFFSSAASSASEAVGPHTITVNLSNSAATTTYVDYIIDTPAGSAVEGAGNDYTLTAGTLTFNAGVTSQNITLTVINDTIVETNETVNLKIQNPSGGGGGATLGVQQTHAHTINDNDSTQIRFAATSSSVAENILTPFQHSVVVSLTNASSAAVSVDYVIQGSSTATGAGSDYTLAPNTLTFAAGETSKTIILTLVDDNIYEGNETVDVHLQNIVATLGETIDLANDDHPVTITDNETQPTIRFQAATSNEFENVADSDHRFNVILSHPSTQTIAVNAVFVAAGNTAEDGGSGSGDDYNFTSPQTITFTGAPAGGSTTQEVIVGFNDDVVYEGDEIVNFTLASPSNATIDAANDDHAATIKDDESKPTIRFMTFGSSADEMVNLPITLTLSGPTEAPVTANIKLRTSPGTATSGTDYTTSLPYTITFPALDTSENLVLGIVNDTMDEPNETVSLEIDTATISANAAPGSPLVFGHTIQDNDATPQVNFALGTSTQLEDNTNKDIVINLNRASYQTITVDYRLRVTGGSGTATSGAGNDYTFTQGTLTYLTTETSKTIQVSVLEDAIVETTETVILEILNVSSGATIGATNEHTLQILDDDVVNDITVSALTLSSVTSTSFNSQISFTGDDNSNAVVTMYWCNASIVPSCNPETSNSPVQGSVVMSRGAGVYTAASGALAYPNFAGDTLNVRVVTSDTDGVTGSPLNTTTQLLPVLDVQEMAKVEGTGFDFVITINKSYSSNVTFSYGTSDGTATAGGNDYTSASGTATIIAGQTSVTLPNVATNNDATGESTETFNLNISVPVNATIRTASSPGRILDNDPGLTRPSGVNSTVRAIAVQSDGKRVVGGDFSIWDATIDNFAVRLNADGSEDLSFNIGTGFSTTVKAWLKQPDGKIIAGGDFTSYNGSSRPYLARINSDGSIDTGFVHAGTGLNSGVNALALQSDGKIIVGGSFATYNGTSTPRLARINSDGTLDTSFVQTGTGFNNTVNAISLQSDGKVIVGGQFITYNGTSTPRLARINTDGTLDTGFVQTGTGLNFAVNAISLQSDGKIIIGGSFTTYNGTSAPYLARINTNGTLDTGFVQTGTGLNNGVMSVQIQSDSKVLAGGAFTNYNGTSRPRLARINTDGTLDTGFVQTGTGLDSSVNALSLQSDGKVVVGGNFVAYNGTSRPRLARINTNGTLDTGFVQTGIGLDQDVLGLQILSDGKIIAGGYFKSYNGTSSSRLARINTNGTLDTGFVQTGTGFNANVRAIAIQSDGKIIVGGNFVTYNGTSRPRLARLNSDGTLDTGFVQTGTGLNNAVQSVAMQSDGKIIAGGFFNAYNGTSRPNVVRINTNGTLDTGFVQTGTGLTNGVNSVQIQSDGKILAGGQFITYNGTSRPYLARINTNGTLDTSFVQTGTGLSTTVEVLSLQSDGKIIVGGSFTSYNGTSTPRLARMNSDGTLDTSFVQTGTGLNNTVYALSLQSDGKILAGGVFTTYNALPKSGLVRINSDGTQDTSFVQTGTGFNGGVLALSSQSDGKIIVGGLFTFYDTVFTPYLKDFSAPNDISIGNLAISNVTHNSFDVSVGYYGDANNTPAVLTAYYCSETDNAGCSPETPNGGYQGSLVLTRNGNGNGTYTGTISGLSSPLDPSDLLNIRVVAVDVDGVTGSPMNSTVELKPLLNIADLTIVEGANAAAVVSLASGAYATGNVVFNWATSDATAKQLGSDPDDDYTISSGTATITAGSASVTLPNITTKNDSNVEITEYFTITLSSLQNAVAGDIVGQVNLTDNDTIPTISVNDPSAITEGAAVSFVVTLSSARASGNVVFDYSTQDGTAKQLGSDPDDDYTVTSGTATILAGSTSVTLPNVVTKDDSSVESAENFTMVISNVTNVAGAGNDLIGQGTLNDNDAAANDITVSALTLSSVTSSSFNSQISFTGDVNTNAAATMYWCNATANAGCNPETSNSPVQGSVVMTRGSGVYTAASGALPYPNFAGDTLNVRVVTTDTDGVTGSPLNTTTQLLPVLDVEEMAKTEGSGLGFVVTINKSYSSNVTFNYSTSDGTATVGGNDYTSASGTATIIAGQTSVTLPNVATNNDATGESTETFNMVISSPNNATIRTASSPGRILDNDPGISRLGGANSNVRSIAIQPDGKRIVGGDFTLWDDTIDNRAIRLNADGSEDLSFNIGAGFNNTVLVWLKQPDGKIIACGLFTTYNGTSRPYLVRLNSDGTLDTSFTQTGTGLSNAVRAISLQSDGKIIAGGSFTDYNGTSQPYLARLNSNGTLDTSFAQTGTGLSSSVSALSLQSDGKIIAGGSFTDYNGTSRPYLARLNSDGTLDTSFVQTGTGLSSIVNALSLQSDGKIIAGGNFANYNGTSRPRLARINADGTLDTSFVQTGTGLDSNVFALSLQSDGKIIAGGNFTNYNGTSRPRLARINTDGTLDTSFAQTGTGLDNIVNALSLQSDGKIVVGGQFLNYNGTSRPYLARINSNGTLDTSFVQTGTGLSGDLRAVSILSDGKIVAGGNFLYYNAISRPYLARLNSDNTLDTGFVQTGTGLNGSVRALSLQSDGKIIAGGLFTNYDGTSRPYLARINTDGTLDTSFVQTGTGLNNQVNAVTLQSDGKIIAGGNFTDYNGTSRPYLARINTDGTLDTSFVQTGTGLSTGNVHALSIQSDGKIIVGGGFTNYNGTSRPRLARINTDGTLDTSFVQAGTGLSGLVNSIILQIDGKIIVSGGFANYNGTSRPFLARINTNGTLDFSFAQTGTGLNSNPNALSLQSDGKIIAGGFFGSYNGTNVPRLARINTNGTLDTSFVQTGTGLNAGVRALGIQSDGKIVVGGEFTLYDTVYTPYYKDFSAPNDISIGNLAFSNVTHNSFDVSVGYYGDVNNTPAVLTAYYCSEVDNAGCNPQTPNGAFQGSLVLTKNGSGNGTYTGTISGLVAPLDPSDTLNIRVVAVDADGVGGSPLNSTIELRPLLNIADVTIVEGLGAWAVVSLASGNYTSNVVFNWATSDGTATVAGADYTANSGTATISAGLTSVSLPIVFTNNNATPETSEYFTITLSSINNAVAGDIVGQVNLVDSANGIQLTSLVTSAVSAFGFTATVNFVGDVDTNATAVLWYCNQTDSPGCNPESGSQATMTRSGSTFVVTMSGLTTPNNPNDVLNIRAVVADTGGVYSTPSPLNGTVTLTPSVANDITVSALTFSSVTSTSFNSQINFIGDANTNAVATMYWCNASIVSSCNPETANSPVQGSVVMSRGAGVYTAASGALAYPNFAGDNLNIRVVVTDINGVTGSPLNTTTQLLPVLDVEEMARVEGNSFHFVVTMNKTYSTNVTFSYGTSDGTATVGSNDYTSISGTATIVAGQTSVTLPNVATNNDATAESTETFNMAISLPNNATLRTSSSPGRIMDNDPGLNRPSGLDGTVNAIKVQSDGKRVVGGAFTLWDASIDNRAIRLNADGSEDLSFNIGGGFNNSVNVYVKQPDGKILTGGGFTAYNGTSRPYLARINSDGSLDTSFVQTGTGLNSNVNALGLQSDGKIIIGGNFTSYNGTSRPYLARINTDGSLDTSFVQTGTGLNLVVQELAVQSDGKIVVAGLFATYNGTSRPRLARINTDGTLDTSFVQTGTGLNSSVHALALQSDGKVLAGGDFTSYNGTSRPRLARINTDGTLDTGFVQTGTGLNSTVYELVLQSDGKVLAGGWFASYNGTSSPRLARINMDGTLDTSFVQTGTGLDSYVYALALQSDGKVLAGGVFTTYNGTSSPRLARLNTDGSLDTGFVQTGAGLNSQVNELALQSDGKVIIGGNFTSYAGTSSPKLARLNTDGSLDTGFVQTGAGLNGLVNALSIQSDGKVLAGGSFTDYNGTSRPRLARINTDGSLDTSFVQTGTGLNNVVNAMALQSDGKVLVGGGFATYNGTSSPRLARINTDGTLDTSFVQTGTGLNTTVSALALQSDGKVLAGGFFTAYNGISRPRLARINTDGTLDTSFVQTGTGLNNNVGVLAIQSDGKILAGGMFANYNGTSSPYLARINTDGTLDNSFVQTGTGLNTTVSALALQSDGKVLAGGVFTTYNGTSRPFFARINTDGTLDSSFVQTGTGLNNTVSALALQSDGKITAGGSFTYYDTVVASRLKDFSAPNDISVGNLRKSGITSSTFTVAVGYYGDADEDSDATLYYCNHTVSPGCNPTSGSSAAMSATTLIYNGDYTATINSGLVSGNAYNIRVITTDPDGVSGGTINDTVTLP
jgi:uncharacterized delta-60 repeat protein